MAGESADAEEETERAGGITEDFSDGGETQEPLPEAADTESGENAEDLEEENDKGNGKRRKRRGRSSENGKRRRRRRGRKKREFKKPGKKFFIITGGVIGGLILIYLGISAYFISHFFVNTTINGKDFSGKSAKAVEEYIRGEVNGYELTIIEQNNDRNIIKGSEIGLTYKESSEIEDALKKQNPLLWPAGFFSQSSTQVSVGVDYDEALLDEKLQSIKAMSKEQTEPVSAYPKYNGNLFEVEPEVYGSAVDTEALKEKTVQYITEFRDSLNMMDEGCYKMPAYTSDSEEVKNACNTMNQYLKAKITYTMDEEVVVDKDLISQWVTCDSEMNVTFNEEAVKAWMREFGEKYDTVGKTRSFTTPDGKQTQVSGGTYGWIVNEAQEAQNLIENIKNGENITKEPEYKQTAASRSALDWGTTYAEVDLAAQKMWFVVDGSVALTTDVVTGRPSTGNATPEGVYDILYTQRGAVLRGDIDPATGKPSYETPVSFWMPFTYQGHGFHDATWQSAFGGNRYLTHGSHGCVNMPYDKASQLFELITAGTPVIIHS
ncbi:MAG TPA: L,D-transpeptidase/peptidoglycan binding protein [Candidatus Mediterraneibacter avicola]|nr:L,D-transpeptidase/peptidoglycan binding protein [Candidatus Mediterraneibacter avicola]